MTPELCLEEAEESYKMEGGQGNPRQHGKVPRSGETSERREYFGKVSVCGTEAGNQVGLEERKG